MLNSQMCVSCAALLDQPNKVLEEACTEPHTVRASRRQKVQPNWTGQARGRVEGAHGRQESIHGLKNEK